MEFLTVLIIFFVLSRLLEALGGGNRGRGTGPPRRPQRPLPRQQRHPGLPEGSDAPPAARPEDAAAEMIPDELWELLTGEKRQRPHLPAPGSPDAPGSLPVPRPAGPPVAYNDPTEEELESLAYDEEARLAELELRRRRDENAEAADLLERRRAAARREVLPERVAPEVVSLETEPLPEQERHRRFHAKIDRPKQVAAPRPSGARRLGLGGPEDLRRAFILHELLGPPVSLKDEQDGF